MRRSVSRAWYRAFVIVGQTPLDRRRRRGRGAQVGKRGTGVEAHERLRVSERRRHRGTSILGRLAPGGERLQRVVPHPRILVTEGSPKVGERRERHPQGQRGNRHQELDDPLDDRVDPSAVEPGDATQEAAEDEAERYPDQADRERDARRARTGAAGTWCRCPRCRCAASFRDPASVSAHRRTDARAKPRRRPRSGCAAVARRRRRDGACPAGHQGP